MATRESAKQRGSCSAEHFNPTIYLYDSQPGGIGLAERLFEILPDLLRRGLETLEACACACRLSLVRRSGERGRPPRQDHRAPDSSPRSPPEADAEPRRAPPGDPPHRRRPARRGRPPTPVEQVVDGELRRRPGQGTILVVRRELPARLTAMAPSRSAMPTAAPLEMLARAARIDAELGDAGRLLFLDTETTGLAGGTGTYAFLVGAALARRRSRSR